MVSENSDIAKSSRVDIEGAVTAGETNEKIVRSATVSGLAFGEPFNETDTKKLLLKLDLHLIPFLALIYLLCFLDRTNVGNARLVHMEKDLKMEGLDYNIALAILFPFYVAAEIPSNMMMKRFRPSIWLTFIMVCWSIVMICMGFVRNFAGLTIARAFLGIAEGGLFPGVSYFITMWYRRHECGLRMALFFSAATIAGAFGGLLARGISAMDGVGGYAGWRWIFILEGLITLIVSSCACWAINDYPETSAFLTPTERAEVERRLATDHDGLSNEFHIKYLYQALRDWKIWVKCIITLGIFTPLYSIALFLPTIIKLMGYSNNAAQLMTVPVYGVACVCTIVGNYLADRAGQRGVFLVGFQALAIAGFLMLVQSAKPHVQYAGTFLAASGIYTLVPMIGAWNSNNIGGSLKRGIGIAMQVGIGNLGGVISAFVYLSQDGPRFIKGHSILIGLTSMSLVLTASMSMYFRLENARRDKLMRDENISLDDVSVEMKYQQREMGDDAVFFRYTI